MEVDPELVSHGALDSDTGVMSVFYAGTRVASLFRLPPECPGAGTMRYLITSAVEERLEALSEHERQRFDAAARSEDVDWSGAVSARFPNLQRSEDPD